MRNASSLPDHVDNRYHQGAETDTAKRVCHGPAEGASCRTRGQPTWFTGHEEPGAVDAGDDAMDSVFQPLGDPVAGEGDENEQPYHCG